MAVAVQEPTDAVARVLKGFDQDLKAHQTFARDVDRRYRAYRGVMERRSQAASWTNKQHPAYVLQIIETMIASALDPQPGWKISPRAKMGPASMIQAAAQGAKAMEILLREQLDNDHFAEKQRPFAMQGFIAGLTANKNYWRYSAGTRTRLGHVDQAVEGTDYTIPVIAPVQGTQVFHDDPTVEIVDVRDLILHEAATSLEKCMRVTHRCWYSMDELRQLQAAGVYTGVDQLTDTNDFSGQLTDREQELFQTNRAKNQVEVLEQWFYDKGEIWVITVGNRKVCLTPGGKAKPNPFWHGSYPFVVASSMPDLFRIPGISEVEVVQELQEMLWTLGNQRLDSTQMINNAIALIRSDVDDPDAYEWAPGERWIVDDVNQVKLLEIDPMPAQLSLGAESAIKNDMQNISGGMPMMSGTDQQIDSSTATSASIFTSLAQRRIAAKKMNYTWAWNRTGEQWIQLNQQFIRESRALEIVGPDGAPLIKEVNPMEIQGQFRIKAESMDESLMRQERRAEAQALLQVAVSSAGAMAASKTPLNLKAFMDKLLDAFDIQDTSGYYSQNDPLQQGAPQQKAVLSGKLTPEQEMVAATNAGLQPPAGAQGTTAPQGGDANSPSNAFSQSPVAAQQRMAAMAGGPNNH